jgi:predicted transcriptional regulator of viral defense system
MKQSNKIEEAIQLIRHKGGLIRTKEALNSGIHPRTLYFMRDNGILFQVNRGLFELADESTIQNIDLVSVAIRAPQAVVCLVSALSFHGITSQVPHQVSIALKKGAETPRIDFPPIKVYRFSGASFESGIGEYKIDDKIVRVYNPEKTLADCFKFRNKIGMDIVLEAFKLYRERKEIKVADLMHYAKICRVESIMKPYIEASI